MKNINTYFTAILVLLASAKSFSQEDTKKISITDVSLLTGYFDAFSSYPNVFNSNDLRSKSSFFDQHYPQFNNLLVSKNFFHPARSTQMMVGLDLSKFNLDKKWKSQIRGGISFQNSRLDVWNSNYSSSGVYDTLFSNNSSDFIVRDTTLNKNL